MEFCDFPTIVLVSATANLEISVAGAIYVSKLPILDLSLGFHASDQRNRSCQSDLEKYYKLLQASQHLVISPMDVRNTKKKKTFKSLEPNY